MQNIVIKPQFENGRYYFELPEYFKDSGITIQLIVKKEKSRPQEIRERIEKVRAFAGIAKDSTYEPEADECYIQ